MKGGYHLACAQPLHITTAKKRLYAERKALRKGFVLYAAVNYDLTFLLSCLNVHLSVI